MILSDDHRTFISEEQFLLEMQDDPEVQEYLADRQIVWRHQAPQSQWMGGHYEQNLFILFTAFLSHFLRDAD